MDNFDERSDLFTVSVMLMLIGLSVFLASGLVSLKNLVRGSSVSKIVNGEVADIADYPHQISLEFNGSHWCGGSIISTTRILTAAHCTYQLPPSTFTIRAGSSIREQGGQVRVVSEKHEHPEYDFPLHNDVVVLVLMEALVLDNKVQIIQLAADSNQPVGSYAVVTGWGFTANRTLSTVLQVVRIEKFNDTMCTKYYRLFRPYHELCYGTTVGKSPCSADSGGAVLHEGLQIGLVSYGVPACDGTRPSVYANVAYHLEFIQSHM